MDEIYAIDSDSDGTLLRGPHLRLTLVQQEAALFPWLTVGGNVRFGLRGLPRAEQDRRAEDSLALVGLPDLGGRRRLEAMGMEVHALCAFEGL